MFFKLKFYLPYYFIITLSQNLVESSHNFSVFDDIMSEIVNDCYENFEYIMVTDIFSPSHRLKTYPVLEIECPRSIMNMRLGMRRIVQLQHEIDAYFVLVDNLVNLGEILRLRQFINVVNDEHPIFIFNTEIDDQKKTIEAFINVAWEKWKALNIYYIFYKYGNGISIITYNPYAFYAPSEWTPFIRGNISFFIRSYNKGSLCQELTFDRTEYLNYTEVKILLPAQGVEGYCPFYRFLTIDSADDVTDDLTKALKIRASTYCWNTRTDLDRLEYVINKNKPDIILFHTLHPDYVLSYPPYFIDGLLLSHNQGYQSLFEQIYTLFGKWLLFYTSVLLIATFIVCYNVARASRVSFAIFDILRLLINASIRTEMKKSSTKIFFSMIFIFFLILQSLFQGKLAEFLVKPQRHKNADVLDDLESPKYSKILCLFYESVLMSSWSPILREKTHYEGDLRKAAREYKNNKTVVVIALNREIASIINYSPSENYVSNERIFRRPFFYPLLSKSPLIERINSVLLRLIELGVASRYQREEDARLERPLYITNQKYTDSNVNKRIDLKSIIPIITMLAAGLIIATMCFIGEIITYRLKKNKKINYSQ